MFSLPTEIPSWVWPALGAAAVLALGAWTYMVYRAWRMRRATHSSQSGALPMVTGAAAS